MQPKRITNKTRTWQNKFLPVLKPIHKHFAKKVFHRLMKKSATLKQSLKRRSREYEVECSITLDDIRFLFLGEYGTPCRYCETRLDIGNIVCDHIEPLSNGGCSIKKNLQIICSRCNTRKGNISHQDYIKLLTFLEKQSDDLKSYVLRKLAKGDNFK